MRGERFVRAGKSHQELLAAMLRECAGRTLYVYGARPIAYGAMQALMGLDLLPKGYVVTARADNPQAIDGMPVHLLADLPQEAGACFFLAVPEYLQPEIRKSLAERGFSHVIGMDADLEFALMGSYYRSRGLHFAGDSLYGEEEDLRPPSMADIEIYVAQSARDSSLRHSLAIAPPFYAVHAGAALDGAEDALAGTAFRDDDGESISEENRDYAELTVTYWAWKNRHPAVKGLAHYRRYLALTEQELALLLQGIADVILPLPFLCWPDASVQYGRYNHPLAIEAMHAAIEERSPAAAEQARKILRGKQLYQYNMPVARAEVFDAYAAWIFPILARAKEIFNARKGSGPQPDRLCGHMGEILTSLYFTMHRKHLHIIHGRKVWLT